MQPAEVVLKFLASVGPSTDAEFYLRLFRSLKPESFAVLVVDAATMADNADAVAMDLRFLRILDLTPVVVLGIHEPTTAPRNIENLRSRLAEAGILVVSPPRDSDHPTIASIARSGSIPVVGLQGETLDARVESLGRLLTSLESHKLIFLRTRGGLSTAGHRLSDVNLNDEADWLVSQHDLSPEDLVLTQVSRRLVFDLVPHKLLVSLTSPINLLRELFTIKGAGTLLRKGARIMRYDGIEELDRERLRVLLSSSFGREPADHVFSRPITHAYLDEEYRGAALVVDTELGGYLTKFAVTREAQGEGIGRDLWHLLSADYPRLLWRARNANPIGMWYERQCDGRARFGPWTVYFRGVEAERISEAVQFALAQPLDFPM